MSRIDYITFGSPNFVGPATERTPEIDELYRWGHARRPEAGLFEKKVSSLVSKKTIGPSDIKAVLRAADEELKNTSYDRSIFHEDLVTFYEEWGHKFSSPAELALKNELGHDLPQLPKLGSSTARAASVPQLNGICNQLVADSKLTTQELEMLLTSGGSATNGDSRISVVPVLRSLYRSANENSQLNVSATTMGKLRACIQDPAWVAKFDFVNSVKKHKRVTPETARQIHKAAQKAFSKMYGPDLVRAASAALKEHGVAEHLFTMTEMTPEGRDELGELFAYDRLGRNIRSQEGDFDLEVVQGFMTDFGIEHGTRNYRWQQKFMQDYKSAARISYFDDPRITPDALAWLDQELFGIRTAQARPRIQNFDILMLYKILVKEHTSADATVGDPDEGDELKLRLEENHDLLIEGATGFEAPLRVRSYPELALFAGDRELAQDEIEQVLSNELLREGAKNLVNQVLSREDFGINFNFWE